MSLLAAVELGLLARKTALDLRDLHALAGTEPDQVGLEPSNHGQDVEQQPADRVRAVIDRPAQAEADLVASRRAGTGPVSSLVTTKVSPGPARNPSPREPGTLTVDAGRAVVGVDLLTDKQKDRGDPVATEAHVQVEATWGDLSDIAAYRDPDRGKGRDLMVKLMESVSHGVPACGVVMPRHLVDPKQIKGLKTPAIRTERPSYR